jgi:hypothetical protein
LTAMQPQAKPRGCDVCYGGDDRSTGTHTVCGEFDLVITSACSSVSDGISVRGYAKYNCAVNIC